MNHSDSTPNPADGATSPLFPADAPQRAPEAAYEDVSTEGRAHWVAAPAWVQQWFARPTPRGRGFILEKAATPPVRRTRDHDGVVRLSCRITPQEARELDEACALLNMTRSDVQRHALRFLLKNLEHHRKDAA